MVQGLHNEHAERPAFSCLDLFQTLCKSRHSTSAMAARKSCTKLTWDEAKAKVGISNAATKKKPIPKSMNHGDALTAKVIARNGASQQELSQHISLMKKMRREEERAAAAAGKREEERERARAEQVVKPHEQARERMSELALQQGTASLTAETSLTSDIDLSEMNKDFRVQTDAAG